MIRPSLFQRKKSSMSYQKFITKTRGVIQIPIKELPKFHETAQNTFELLTENSKIPPVFFFNKISKLGHFKSKIY